MSSTAGHATDQPRTDEVSVAELLLRMLRFYARFARLLLIPSLLLAVLAAVLVASRPLYQVTALIEVPGLKLEDWRQAQSFLWDPAWVAAGFGQYPGAEADGERLRLRALQRSFWETSIQYRSALRRDDMREVPVADVQNTRGLGLELSLRARDEAQADAMLRAIVEHTRQALLAGALIERIRNSQASILERPKLRIERLQAAFEIEQSRVRIEDMRQLLERYPELRQQDSRALVSVQDGGGKYLGPLDQLIALEATISETRAKERAASHALEKLDWMARQLDGVDAFLRQATSGEAIAHYLQQRQAMLFPSGTALPAAAQEAEEQIRLELDEVLARHEATGVKARSAISSTPVPQRNPLWVGLGVFVLSLLLLSACTAAELGLRGPRAFGWLPARARRWLTGLPA